MIKSIKFTGESGYISYMNEEPVRPRDKYYNMTKEESEEYYKKELKWYNKHKDEYKNPYLAKNLLNRTFNFEENKINVIFGPNGCGKTTIIKALTGYALIEDGFPYLRRGIDIGFWKEISEKEIIEFRKKLMKNSAEVEWDGVPIYFENIASRRSHSIGDLQGALLSDTASEVSYIMNKNRTSLGQNSIFLFNRVLEIAVSSPSLKDILQKQYEHESDDLKHNDYKKQCYDIQMDYFKKYPKFDSNDPITIVFDEMDKSLDILNVIYLYKDLLPNIIEKTGIQIITVSHSPVIMSDLIYNSDKYNIISLDDEYTEKTRNELKNIFI